MNNLIKIIPVLNEDQCNLILNASAEAEMRHTTVFGTNGEEIVEDSIRNNTMLILDEVVDQSIVMMLNSAVKNALQNYKDQVLQWHFAYDGWPMPAVGYTSYERERFQLLSYEVDQHYTWHFDQAVVETSPEKRRELSMVLYLTNDFEGGYTWFPYQKYKPRPGEALFFPSNWCFPHCSEKVASGNKKVIVTWFQVKYTPGMPPEQVAQEITKD